eukprot:TRINITY_DN23893_c0_g1_i1.p1 TRINITY_DN23893_c0_g1~~TRINITY_DN23893_c0_g1_i1.p1  ORF type:complete len:363 (-),score=79.42 TRINITY_DN23893_c0_g1_i1:682-1770(-)
MSPVPSKMDTAEQPQKRPRELVYPCTFEAAALSRAGIARPLDQLPELGQHTWRKVKFVSNAQFGKVYVAAQNQPQEPCGCAHEQEQAPRHFAVKAMKRERVLAGGSGLECARNEIYASLALSQLGVKGIAEVYGVAQDASYFYLSTEYCSLGELLAVINSAGASQDELVLKEVAVQLFQTLETLHQHGIAHRDVSLENILVAEDGSLRLIDFGQAILVHGPGERSLEVPVQKCFRGMPGKLEYRAPEVVCGGAPHYLATQVDVFALGVVMYILLTGEYLISPRREVGSLFPNLEADRFLGLSARLHERGLRVSAEFTDFLERTLAPNPDQRLTAKQALHHPWLAGGNQAPVAEDADQAMTDA